MPVWISCCSHTESRKLWKNPRICSDGKLQWACLSQYTCIYMYCQHMHCLCVSITWGFIKLYHTKINQSLPFKSIFSLLSLWKSSQSLQSVMERFPRNMLPRSIFGKLIFGSLTLGILNSGIWMFPKSIFGIVMEGIWILERSNDGRLMFGICILEKSTFGNDIFLKSISGIFIFCRFTEGSLTLGNLIFGNRSFSSKKSKEINESNN